MAQFKGAFITLRSFCTTQVWCVYLSWNQEDMTTKVKVLSLGNSYNMHKMFEIPMTCLTHQMAD